MWFSVWEMSISQDIESERSWILPWLSIQITNTVKIFIKTKCGPGEHQKAARYGQVQPEVWSSLKTSSFPPLPCFSMILPKEGHPEHHFWKCIGKKQFGIPENGNKKLLFPDTAVKAIFNSILWGKKKLPLFLWCRGKLSQNIISLMSKKAEYW